MVQVSTIEDQIREIEEELKRTKYNKATEHHVGRLKAKLARLKRDQLERTMSRSGGGTGFDVKKSGDASVALIGLPSVGKSTLLNQLTNRSTKTAHYAFTTLDAIPGIMEHKGARIQIIDLPGIISGASKGKGRGREVLSVARSSDLILIVLDIFDWKSHLELIMQELFHVGIRLNSSPPDIVIKKTERGGIAISTLKPLTKTSEKTIQEVMREYKIINADVTIRGDPSIEEVIDVLEGNRVYIKALIVVNKMDLVPANILSELTDGIPEDALLISAETGKNIDLLRDMITEKLELIRIYLKPQGGEPDYEEPLIMIKNSTVGDVCDKIHKSFRSRFRYARVWGKSAKHPGQVVHLDHVLEDEDVLTLILRKA